MAQLDTSIPMSYQQGPNSLQQFGQALSLKDMMDQSRIKQQQFANEQAMQPIKMQQEKAALEGAKLDNQSKLAEQEHKKLTRQYDLAKMQYEMADKEHQHLASDLSTIDLNDPENAMKAYATDIYPFAQAMYSTDKGMFKKPEEMTLDDLAKLRKHVIDSARTIQEQDKIQLDQLENSLKQMGLGVQKTVAETNAKNAETQAGNLKLQQEKFEYEKNKPKEIKPITPASAEAISGTGFALGKLKTLYDKVNSGDADIFKTTLTGAFVDPDLNDAIRQLTEFHARQQSGAAISKTEWNNFKSQILNPRFLLTVKGRKSAVKNLEEFMGRYYDKGKSVAGSDNWYEDYLQNAKNGVEKITGNSTQPTPPQKIGRFTVEVE